MKKLFVTAFIMIVFFVTAKAQTKADTTEVSQLSQKVEQLKSQIVQTEAQLYEGEKNLKALVDQYQITQYALEKKNEIINLKKEAKKEE